MRKIVDSRKPRVWPWVAAVLLAAALVAPAPAWAISNTFAGINLVPSTAPGPISPQWKDGLNIARDAGFAGIRVPFVWPDIESIEEQYDFSATDPILLQAKGLGLEVTVVVTGANPIYKNRDMALAFARFSAKLAQHNRGMVAHYELFENINEGVATIAGLSVSGPVAQSYSRTFFLAYQAIKLFDPSVKVLVGAMPTDDLVFTSTLQRLGVFDVADGVSVWLYYDAATYDSPDAARATSEGLADLRRIIGPKKLMTIGRVVLTGQFPMAEAKATAYTRLTVQLPALGADRVFFDRFFDDQETDFDGFVSPAGLTRPALIWMKMLNAQLEGMKPVPPPFQYRLLFPQSLVGFSQEYFYQNGGLLECVYWVEGTAQRGMMETRQPYFSPVGIFDINGFNVADFKFQTTQEGWMLTQVPAQAYPQVLQMRSLDLDLIFPPPPNPANAPINLNAPPGSSGGSPSPLP